ncbi:LysR family transcriptional regulator [Shimia sp.]|uniref:LysR family transcriptional regulator n=1 Tax=Shimia sp. TaxID=1954381 RepID=UPI00356292B7
MAIKIEMLRSFCAVAKAGNLAEAAAQLGRTQSAVSMTLKQLEQHLGQPLFESERKNRLTALGEQVFALGLRQLQQFDGTIKAIELSASAPQGVLYVAAVPSIAALLFPGMVAHLAKAHPGLRIELRDADTQQVIDALLQGWADIGIASARHVLNGIGVTALMQDRYGLVCADRHPLARHPGRITIDDVFARPFLRNALCDQIETGPFRDRLTGTHVTVHNTQSLLAMVRGGDWVTVLPRSVMGLMPERLSFRTIADLPDLRQVYLYHGEKANGDGPTRDALDFITGRQWLPQSAAGAVF